MKELTTYLLFGFLVESLVEYIFSEWIGKWTKYISLAVGVILAFAYGLDIIALLTGLSVPIAGYVLTGFVIGRGGNLINDLVDLIKAKTKRAS